MTVGVRVDGPEQFRLRNANKRVYNPIRIYVSGGNYLRVAGVNILGRSVLGHGIDAGATPFSSHESLLIVFFRVRHTGTDLLVVGRHVVGWSVEKWCSTVQLSRC